MSTKVHWQLLKLNLKQTATASKKFQSEETQKHGAKNGQIPSRGCQLTGLRANITLR